MGTLFKLCHSAAMLLLCLYSTAISTPTAPLNLLTACLPLSHGLAALGFLLPHTLTLSNSPMQELINISILSFLLLVNSGTPFLLPSYDLNSFKREVSSNLSC